MQRHLHTRIMCIIHNMNMNEYAKCILFNDFNDLSVFSDIIRTVLH